MGIGTHGPIRFEYHDSRRPIEDDAERWNKELPRERVEVIGGFFWDNRLLKAGEVIEIPVCDATSLRSRGKVR